MMNDIYEIIGRHLRGESNDLDQKIIRNWLQEDKNNEARYNELLDLWHNSEHLRKYIKVDHEIAWERLSAKIPNDQQNSKPSVHFGWITAMAAALFFGVFFLNLVLSDTPVKFQASATDDPTEISLPDGSKVFMNKGADIEYIEQEDTRSLVLNGEAYFDIEPDKNHPFIIKTGLLFTEVIGTSFNINASHEDDIVVSVTSGIVALYDELHEDNAIKLRKGHSGTYNSSSSELIYADHVNPNFLSWKTGILTFNNTPMNIVSNDLSNHFGVTIIPTNKSNESRLTAVFDNRSLIEILELIELTTDVKLTNYDDVQ